jgi:hypothetical protein
MDSTPPAWQDFFDAAHRLQSEMTKIDELKQRAVRALPHLRGEEEFERMHQSYRRLKARAEEEQAAEAAEAGYPIPTHSLLFRPAPHGCAKHRMELEPILTPIIRTGDYTHVDTRFCC